MRAGLGIPAEEVLVEVRASLAARLRVADLVARQKRDGLTPEEAAEPGRAPDIEHRARLAKAEARLAVSGYEARDAGPSS